MQSFENKVLSKIIKRGRGKIFFGNEFALLGSNINIRQALSRLCKKGTIIRLSPGVYLYPKLDKTGDIIYPTVNEIMKQIMKRDRAKIVPTGVYALNALGLSTQVPMRYVFLTDGAARILKIGKLQIKLQKTVAKNLAYKSEVCVLVIFALKEIGKGKPNEEELQKIYAALSHESKEKITHDALLAPNWISTIMLNYLKNKDE
ncbi:MAG: type IV toxin-antitoxin system AbiEi family antitoxin domain-containing protein [Candidatus Symbiothrix sp.]|nr:type IV toxin-antitoxin system AbiEi family antitoxin domain-containing protein [Candidatus Symbiothrix sp.]